jgi:ubiquinone/menaquinone biosynthesis C-methylase UbiE
MCVAHGSLLVKLNTFERLVVNQPLRPFLQRWLEARPLLKMGGEARGRVLEIGCGQGLGAQILMQDFGVDELHGFDLDRRQLQRAQRRLNGTSNVYLWQGSANQLPTPAHFYDAVFDFNVLHHIPDWQCSLSELARVMKPGAKLYLLETLSFFLNNPLSRVLMKHPRQNRFNFQQLCDGVNEAGFEILQHRKIRGSFCWMVAQYGG